MSELTLATLQSLERAAYSAYTKFEKRAKVNPACTALKAHADVLGQIWVDYRKQIAARETTMALAEPEIFTRFIPEDRNGCATEITRTKTFKITRYNWRGRRGAPNVERVLFYKDPFKHFRAFNSPLSILA